MERTLHRVKLYGSLGDTYGTEYIEVYANSIKEVFRNLSSRFGEGFKQTILNSAWHISKGKRAAGIAKESDNFISEKEIDLPSFGEELHIFPVTLGAGGKGVGQIILGVVLIIIAVVLIFTGVGAPAGGGIIAGLTAGGLPTALALAGVMSIAGGIMAMLTKSPELGDYSSAGTDQRQSFIFNGAVNNTEQGVPVPLVYGEHLTGTTIISAGMDVEQL